ncbi:MAG: thioredoxin family protein [Saprospiraceae bacterium]|nr:thioredoxin family protein [Saprospiraceae bacterium]
MKKTIFTLVALLLTGVFAFAQGIVFFEGSWDEAKAKAKSEGKLIFADAFAAWCGPCKRMASQTFPDPAVGAFFNANFVCVKYDMEKPENAAFATAYPVRSYPTLLFIDADGKIVKKEVGAKTPDALVELGRNVLGAKDNLPGLEEQYAAGARDPEFMYEYVKALNRAGQPSLKVTNEYLATQTDMTTPFNLEFIFEGATEADSRVFDLLLQHRDAIAKSKGAETVDRKITAACGKSVNKAIEFRDAGLLQEAKQKLAKALPDKAVEFTYKADTRYYAAADDPKNFLKAAQTYQKAAVKNNPAALHDLVVNMMRSFPQNPDVLKQAEKWAKTAAETGNQPDYYMTLAGVYKNSGDKDAALHAAVKAKELVGDSDPNMTTKINGFIRSLDQQ